MRNCPALLTFLTGLWLSHTTVARSAANPFLGVTAWRGTFTHRVTDQGSFSETRASEACTTTWNIAHDASIQSPLRLDESTLAHPFYRYWFSTNNVSESVSVDESFLEECRDPDGDV